MAEVILKTDRSDYASELLDVCKLFGIANSYRFSSDFEGANDGDITIEHRWNRDGRLCKDRFSLYSRGFSSEFLLPDNSDALTEKKLVKRHSKALLYSALSEISGKTIPWGSLTGIRPTKIYYELENEGLDPTVGLRETFGVSESKIKLLREIAEMQRGLLNDDRRAVDIYVGIPFCVSKCVYCSFTGGVIARIGKYVDDYVRVARKEVENALEIVRDNGLRLDNVYVGGGTPTAISAENLGEILSPLSGVKIEEFTVEAGRPDTITEEHLKLFEKMKVDRVSVNPQTMNADTLAKINRRHTPEDVVDTLKRVKEYGFTVNMDLIAGLPGENAEIFRDSLDKCAALAPENVTVHTLALKRGSTMKEENISSASENEVSEMVDYARKALSDAGYKPYYLYRQKYMTGNLENVGYAKSGFQCLYNIDIMEECKSIIACGSNGISKRVFVGGGETGVRIERFADTKDVKLYVERGDANWEGKKTFFGFNSVK